MSEPITAESDASTDESDDDVSENFVETLISQKFESFDQQNERFVFEQEDVEQDFLDTRCLIIDSFEKLINEKQRLLDESVNGERNAFIGPRHWTEYASESPTCSKFENANENVENTVPFKNNQFSAYEESEVDRTYPLELIKSNRQDKKIFRSMLSERFKSNDVNKGIQRQIELIIHEQHDVLVNIINNNLDTNRMFLEQQIRKTRRLFRTFIRKLIDENYHIAYNEIEFTSVIDKKLIEVVNRMRKRVNKQLTQEKYNSREVFFKSISDKNATLSKYFKFSDFLFSFATLLENKIEIVNSCIKRDMEQVISALRKDIRNFITNQVLLPSHDKSASFGTFIGTNRVTPTLFNETIFINKNFSDTCELLLNFESYPMKAAEFAMNSAGKQNKNNIKRIFDEIAATHGHGSEESDLEPDKEMKILIQNFGLLKDVIPPLIGPLSTKLHAKNTKNKSIKNKQHEVNAQQNKDNSQLDSTKTKMNIKKRFENSGPSFATHRKIAKAKRMLSSSKAIKMSNLGTINETNSLHPHIPLLALAEEISPIPNTSNYLQSTIVPNFHSSNTSASLSESQDRKISLRLIGEDLANSSRTTDKTPESNMHGWPTQSSNKTPISKLSSNIEKLSPVPTLTQTGEDKLNVPSTTRNETTSKCIENVELPNQNHLAGKSDLLPTEKEKLEASVIEERPGNQFESKTNQNDLPLLKDYEKILLSQINKDVAKHIILNRIDKKLEELEKTVAQLNRNIIVANHESQRLLKYKENINKNDKNNIIDNGSNEQNSETEVENKPDE